MSEKFIVETSARHLHLTQQDFETLFGAGAQPHPKKDLSQPGQFACEEKITVVGPKGSLKMSLLGPFQVTPTTAVKVYEFFGPTCVEILRSRPYELCRISGFGFKRVDAIIRKTDKRLDTPDRIQGALMYVLQEAGTQQGHLYLPRTELLQAALQLLNSTVPQPKLHLHTEQVETVLQDAILHGDLVANEDAI